MSFPCLLRVVGSWLPKKTVRSVLYETSCGLNSMYTTSAWPVVPLHTCSYVGFGTVPPEYPGKTTETPLSILKTASVHQKHPPPKTAISFVDFMVRLISCNISPAK